MSKAESVKPIKRTIDLGDGVEREVSFSLNAMAELEEKYGSIESAFDKIKAGSVAAIRFMLWCILIGEDDNLTEREVGNMINLTNLKDIMSTIMEVLEEQMPDASEMPADTSAGALQDPKVIPMPNSDW